MKDINNPDHYTQCKYECIDVLDELNLGFCLSNVIKYIWRHRDKGNSEKDLRKAAWYLNHYIANKFDSKKEEYVIEEFQNEVYSSRIGGVK